MLTKNKYISRFFSFLLIISFSLVSNFSVLAQTTKQYKVTGCIVYVSKYNGHTYGLYGTRPIENGYLVEQENQITFTCNHENNLYDIELIFIKDSESNWHLKTFNEVDYEQQNNLGKAKPIISNSYIYFSPTDNFNDSSVHIGFYALLNPLTDTASIPHGQYKGTGTASVETVFGTFNLGNLAKTKINAVVTDNQLDLSFQAKNIPYQVQANLASVDSDGTAIYTYSDQTESWKITVTPDGKLDGSLAYTGDRGIMSFSIQLQAK